MKSISVAIITFNAQKFIDKCLEAVKWADEIIIVDSYSVDETVSKARLYTNKIYFRKFDNFSNQKNFAITKANCDWVLSLDADEIITKELAKEIIDLQHTSAIDGYYIERLNNIYGKFLKYDRPDLQLRLFKKGKGKFIQPVHERVYIEKNKTSRLKGKILHYTVEEIENHINKIIIYADYDVAFYPLNKLPRLWFIRKMFFRPLGKFIQHYFVKKAFLDNLIGYIYVINTIMGEIAAQVKYYEYFNKPPSGVFCNDIIKRININSTKKARQLILKKKINLFLVLLRITISPAVSFLRSYYHQRKIRKGIVYKYSTAIYSAWEEFTVWAKYYELMLKK